MTSEKNAAIVRADNVAQRLFEERMLVITPRDSMLHRFNEVGTFIWQLLETPKTADEICEAIKTQFDGVDEEKLTDDITVFVEKLLEKKLVEVEQEEN